MTSWKINVPFTLHQLISIVTDTYLHLDETSVIELSSFVFNPLASISVDVGPNSWYTSLCTLQSFV